MTVWSTTAAVTDLQLVAFAMSGLCSRRVQMNGLGLELL